MRKIVFEDDEMRIISMFDTSDRMTALKELENVAPFTREDAELSALVVNTIEKLKRISDQDFAALDFEIYRLEDAEGREDYE